MNRFLKALFFSVLYFLNQAKQARTLYQQCTAFASAFLVVVVTVQSALWQLCLQSFNQASYVNRAVLNAADFPDDSLSAGNRMFIQRELAN